VREDGLTRLRWMHAEKKAVDDKSGPDFPAAKTCTVGPMMPMTGEGLSGCPTEDDATGHWQIGRGSWQGSN
jgi:hypothetical protein